MSSDAADEAFMFRYGSCLGGENNPVCITLSVPAEISGVETSRGMFVHAGGLRLQASILADAS